MKLLASHVAETQMHDPWRRRVHKNPIRKIRILGDDHQSLDLGVKSQFAIRRIGAQIQRVADGQRRLETESTRKILIQQEPVHASSAIWK